MLDRLICCVDRLSNVLRGKAIDRHPGNVRYRMIISPLKLTYAFLPSTKQKHSMAVEVARMVQTEGRFLVSTEINGKRCWIIQDPVEVITKIKQALRENNKKQLLPMRLRKDLDKKLVSNEGRETMIQPIFDRRFHDGKT